MDKNRLEDIKHLLSRFHKVQDCNAIDTMIILVTNVLNKTEKHRLIITEIGLIDEVILTAQCYQQNQMLSETLIWMYSSLMSGTVHLNPGLQEQIIGWAAQVYNRFPNETTFTELAWCIAPFLKKSDNSDKRVQLVMNLNIDEPLWQTVLNGQIGLPSQTSSCQLLSYLLSCKAYRSKYFCLKSTRDLLEQISRRMPFDELTDAKLSQERVSLLYLLTHMLSSELSEPRYFHEVLRRLEMLVKILELSSSQPELGQTLKILTQVLSALHEDSEVEVMLLANKHLFRAVLCKLEEAGGQTHDVSLSALDCIEALLEVGSRFTSCKNLQLDVEYSDGQPPESDNPVKNILMGYAELDYLEQLQYSVNRDVAAKAKFVIDSYF